jgi:gamma-glutamyltranspeptidase / glutathione hydrolase
MRSSRFSRAATVVLAACALPLASCAAPSAGPAFSPMSGKRAESDRGMVAASQPDAAAAGVEILDLGGNAMDAAVATAFALSVTDVSQTGLGGGGALTYYDARARRAEHLSFYPRAGGAPEWEGVDTVTPRPAGRAAATPGMVAGLLEAHGRFGRLTRAQVMAPAIRLAREGFIVTPLLSRTIRSAQQRIVGDSLVRARFLPSGEPLRPGERLMQPELAATLERIATDGARAFYTGPVAERLSAKVRAAGGLITVHDLERYPVASMRPLCTPWREYTVLGAPPPMGGAPTLALLNLADVTGLADAGGFTDRPGAVTTFADIHRLATADGYAWRGDPSVLGVPARGVASRRYAEVRARAIGTAAADTVTAGDPWTFDAATPAGACASDPYPAAERTPAAPPPRSDAESEGESLTSHLSVVDAEGNAVSATTTVGVLFGSGIFTDGFFLNSSANNFDALTRGRDRYTNSTMAPTLVLEGDRVRLVVGAAGSQYIQPATVQVMLRILAFGEDAGWAVAAPRIQTHPQRTEVEVEPGFTSAVYAALSARGYQPLSRVADISFGAVHAVHVRRDGRRIGAADPRRDGVAVGQ